MSEAVRIVRETTLGPIEVQHYLHGGLDGETIKAVHNLARAENVTMGQVVERLFSWDPETGYRLRPHVEQILAGAHALASAGVTVEHVRRAIKRWSALGGSVK